MRTIILIFLSILSLSSACVPIPRGSEVKYVSVVGKSRESSIELRTIFRKYTVIVSPDGIIQNGAFATNEYWLKKTDSIIDLRHLRQFDSNSILREMLAVDNTSLWIAFHLVQTGITKESVQLEIIVFDEDSIRHVQPISGCKRFDPRGLNFWDIRSYAISPNSNNTFLVIDTLSGSLGYDVINGKLAEPGMHANL